MREQDLTPQCMHLSEITETHRTLKVITLQAYHLRTLLDKFNRLGYYWKSKSLEDWRGCLRIGQVQYMFEGHWISSTDKISRLREELQLRKKD